MSTNSSAEHSQVHRPATGDSECTCGGWEGPMTTLHYDDMRSFAMHVELTLTPQERLLLRAIFGNHHEEAPDA